MGKLRKIGKKIKKGFKKIGKKLKKGLGKFARAFGKLGPLGSIALSFILPGLGNIAGWLGNTISAMGPAGKFLVDVSTRIYQAASGAFNYVKGKISTGLGKVFNTVSGAIENGMNTVSKAFGGKGEIGSSFRNFVSDLTGGFVEKSEKGLALETTEDVVTDTLEDAIVEDAVGDTVEDKVTDTVKDKKLSITETVKDKDLKLREKINTSREFNTYKKLQPIVTSGQKMIEGEAAYEAQLAYNENRKSNYFKEEANYILSPLESQNYSQVIDMPMFVDYTNFNPSQDPAQQYLSYRGITDNVNPIDIGGYGFDYQQFLLAQLERV